MESGSSMERMGQSTGVKENGFSKELTVWVWNNLFGKGLVRGRVEKMVRIFEKSEKVLMTVNTRVQFIISENENGMIAWKSQDEPRMVTLKVDKAEAIGVEKDVKTGKNKAIVFREPATQTKAGNIRQVVWRFSPLNSK